MKILTIFGGPKMKGKTASALQLFEEKAAAGGNQVERINISEYKIGGCRGCFACMANPNEPGCIQKDDAPAVFEKMASADVIVFAAPIYSFFLCAQIKPLIDRCFCFSNTSILNGKCMMLLTTCAGTVKGNADLAQEFFRRAFDGKNGGFFHSTELAGTYVVPQSSAEDFMKRAEETAGEMAAAVSDL